MNGAILATVALLGARLVVPLTDQLGERSRIINGVPLVGALGVGLAIGLAAWGVAWVSEIAVRADIIDYVYAGLSAGGIGGGARQLANRARDSGGIRRVGDRPLE
jgi:hypothetical protein